MFSGKYKFMKKRSQNNKENKKLLTVMAYTRNITFIIGVARLENSDCFQLLLISMSQNHDKFF